MSVDRSVGYPVPIAPEGAGPVTGGQGLSGPGGGPGGGPVAGGPVGPSAPAPRPGGPSGRTVAVSLIAAAAAAASVVGAMVGLLRPGPAALTTTLPALSSAGASAGATSSGPAGSPSGSGPSASSSGPAASPSVKPTPSPEPATLVQEPWKDPGLDFAVITGIRSEGAVVTLKVDRLQFLTGSAAKKYYAAHPDLPVQDYAIVNINPRIYTYTLVPNAPLFGAQQLVGTPQPQQMDAAALTTRAGRALANQQKVYVWLRHQDGGKGWTTYLAEQYLP